MITLPTSNSWWIFDDDHKRYRRIPRDMDPSAFVLDVDWDVYSDLEIDADHSAFSVFLNDEKTRIMRGYIESDPELELDGSVSISGA